MQLIQFSMQLDSSFDAIDPSFDAINASLVAIDATFDWKTAPM